MTIHNQNRHIQFSDSTHGMEKGSSMVAQNSTVKYKNTASDLSTSSSERYEAVNFSLQNHFIRFYD